MKKLFLFFAVMATAPQLIAQPADKRGAMKVRASDNTPIVIALDDRRFEKHGTSLTVGDLPKGHHYLRIYEFEGNNNRRGGHAHLLYEGGIRIHKHELSLVVFDMQTGDVNVTRQDINSTLNIQPANNNPLSDGRNNNSTGYNAMNNNTINNGMNNNRTNNGRSDAAAAIARPVNTPVPAGYTMMTPNEMDKTGQKVNDKITDTEKLKVLEGALKKRSFTTEQLGQMMAWLAFDDSRFELAKYGYSHVTDKQNFRSLENTRISNEAVKDQMENFISGGK